MSTLPKPSSLPGTTIANIDRLPPEMLAAIFTHLSTPESDSPGRRASKFVQDLVSVTHVCRSWRRVATTTPEMWTDITMANTEAVKAFLERSGAFPLRVTLRLSGRVKPYRDLLEAAIPHTPRFQQLSILAHRGVCFTGSFPLPEPAPLLEQLAIHHPLGNKPALLFDDQTPRLRELVMVSSGFWLKNHLWNLTSLHLTLSYVRRAHQDFLPFFDMLRRCSALEEMFVSWAGWRVSLEPPQSPTVPLYSLRRLLLQSVRLDNIDNIKYLLHTFDLKPNGIATHLSDAYPGHEGSTTISDIQSMFPIDDSGRPSLISSTKLELVFHGRPQTMIIHTVGPGFSTRVDLRLDGFAPDNSVNYSFCDVFRSVKELWVRGSSRVDAELDGLEHLAALEKLIVIGRGSVTAQCLRERLSPGPSGVLPCPLLSSINFHGDPSEMRVLFHVLRARSRVGGRLEKVRVPSKYVTLPADIAPHVRDVGSIDIPSNAVHMYAMELPEFCFVDGEHKWWKLWRSRSD